MSKPKQIIVFPTGSLLPKDRERLTKEGYLAIEAEDPSKVVLLGEDTPLLTTRDIAMSAMAGVMKGSYGERQSTMLTELYSRIQANEKAASPAKA